MSRISGVRTKVAVQERVGAGVAPVSVSSRTDAFALKPGTRVQDHWSTKARERGVVMAMRRTAHEARAYELLPTTFAVQLGRSAAQQFPNSQLSAAAASTASFTVGRYGGFSRVPTEDVAAMNGRILNWLATQTQEGLPKTRLDAAVNLARLSHHLDDDAHVQRAQGLAYGTLTHYLNMIAHSREASHAMLQAVPYLHGDYATRGLVLAVEAIADELNAPRGVVQADTLDMFVTRIQGRRIDAFDAELQSKIISGLARASGVSRLRSLDIENPASIPDWVFMHRNAMALRAALEFAVQSDAPVCRELFNDCSLWLTLRSETLQQHRADPWDLAIYRGVQLGTVVLPNHEMQSLWKAQLGMLEGKAWMQLWHPFPKDSIDDAASIARMQAVRTNLHLGGLGSGFGHLRAGYDGASSRDAVMAFAALNDLYEQGYARADGSAGMGTLLGIARNMNDPHNAYAALRELTRLTDLVDEENAPLLRRRLHETIAAYAPKPVDPLTPARMAPEPAESVRYAQVDTLSMLMDHDPAAGLTFFQNVIVNGR